MTKETNQSHDRDQGAEETARSSRPLDTRWSASVLENLSQLWHLDIVCVDAKKHVSQAYGDWESLAAKTDDVTPPDQLDKLDKDLFGCSFSPVPDVFSRFFIDFSRSPLRPKKNHAGLAQACLDAAKAVEISGISEISAVSFAHRILLVHNDPQELMNVLLGHYVDAFGVDHALLVVADDDASLEVYRGSGSEQKEAFLELAGHPAINAQIKTLSSHIFDEGFPVVFSDGTETTIGELSVGTLVDMNRPIGYLLLGNEQAGGFGPDQERELSRACDEITSFYKTARLEKAREKKFFQMSRDLAHFKETRDVQEMDFRDLEYRWQELMGSYRRLAQILQIMERLRDCRKNLDYFSRFLEYVKNLFGTATAAVCFGEIEGMYLIYRHHEQSVQTLTFSELDSGIYHDILDRNRPLIWDGHQKRPFFLPSGHPRVRDCIVVPLSVDGRIIGAVMIANETERPVLESEIPSLEKLVSFLAPDLYQAFEGVKSEAF